MLHPVLLNITVSSDVLQVHKVCSEPMYDPCFALKVLFLGQAISLIVEINQCLWRFPRLPNFLHSSNLFFGKFRFPLGGVEPSEGQGRTPIPL